MVTDDFNPYHEWLGLDIELKQPSYYQLLGVDQGEGNMMQIAAAADRAAARVRSIRPGPRAAEWAKVLDEITSAKDCLSDPSRRAQYDRQLAAIQPGAQGGFLRPVPRDKTATPVPTFAQPNPCPTGAPMPASPAAPVQPAAAPMPSGPAAPFPTAPQPTSPAAAPQQPQTSAMPSGGMPGYPAPVAPGSTYPTQQTQGTPAMPTPSAAPVTGAPMAAPQAYPTASPQTPAAGMAPHAVGYAAGGAAPVPGTAAPTGAAPATGQYGTTPATSPAATNLPTGVPLGASSTAATTAAASAGPGVKTGSERTASSMVRKRTDRSKTVPLVAAGLGGAILVLAIVLLVVIGGGGDDENGSDRKRSPNTRPPTSRPTVTPRTSGRPRQSPRHTTPPTRHVTETRKEPEPEGKPPTEPETSPMEPGTETPGETSELPKTPRVDTPPEPTSTPSEPKPGDESKPPVSEPPSDPTEPSPKPKTDPPPAIKPQPKTTPPSTVQPSAAEVATLATALKSARAKLEDSDFDGAMAELRKVESLPKLAEHQAKCERLRLVTEYASNFHSALMEAIKNLEAGDEISAGPNAAAGVVGVTADQITLKIDGRNRSYPINNLSPGLAVAIADTWLDQNDPVCLVAKASYLASLKDDDRLAKAREWFQEASKSGVDIGDLEKVIDDKYDELEKDLAP